jgi:hypothetical protein
VSAIVVIATASTVFFDAMSISPIVRVQRAGPD